MTRRQKSVSAKKQPKDKHRYFIPALIAYLISLMSLKGNKMALKPQTDKRKLRAAMAQIEIIDGDLAENIKRAEAAIREAANQGADFVCLPEAADYGWLCQDCRRVAQPVPGSVYTNFISNIAKELNVWISAGCFEKDGDNVYNSAVIVDRSGEIVIKHRKINTLPELSSHLYDPGKPEDIGAVDTEFGRIGLTICADNFSIEYPKRVAELGAWLLIAPHGFAAKVNDLENNAASYQAHIANIAQSTGLWVVGTDAVKGPIAGGVWQGWPHSGCSTIADPEGNKTVVGKFFETDLIIFDIPLVSLS